MRKIITLLVFAMLAFTSCEPKSDDPSNVEVTSVSLNKTTLNLKVDDTFTLEATIKPENATEKSITWVSSDPIVVTVSQAGVVQALTVGEATITATVGEYAATCAVTVSKSMVAVTNIILNKKTLSLRVHATFALEAFVEPFNATTDLVTWVSSNPTAATVDPEGGITALAVGETTITVTIGSCSASCAVTVFQLDPPKVNDFYYSDGTWSTELNHDKKCIGLVYAVNFDQSSMRNPAATLEKPFPPYVNDPTKPDLKNLVVALENLGDVTVWDLSKSLDKIVKTNATDWYNGHNNTNNSVVRANLDQLPPFKRVYDKQASDDQDWYVPSTYELLKLMLVFNGQSELFKFDEDMSETAQFALYKQQRDAFNARLIEAGGENARMNDAQPKPITGFDDMPVFDDWDTPGADTKWMTEVWDPWYAAHPGYQVALDVQWEEYKLLNYWSSTSMDDYTPNGVYAVCAIGFSCVTPDFSIFPYKNRPENAKFVRPILSFKY